MKWLKKKERFIAKIFQRVGKDLLFIGSKELNVDQSTFSFAKQTFIIDKQKVAYGSGFKHIYFYEMGHQEPILFDKKKSDKNTKIKGRVIDLVVKESVIRQLAEGLTEKQSYWGTILGGLLGVLLGAFGCYMVLDLMGMVI
jgi:hypothetical protein